MGGDSRGQPPAPAAPANLPPALSFPSTGWAPSPAALGGRGRKMVANEEGERREFEPGLPSPISSSISTPASGRSWGMAPRPKVGEGPCWLVNRWACSSGMSWVCESAKWRAEGILVPAPSLPALRGERAGNSLGKNLPLAPLHPAEQPCLCLSASCWRDPFPSGTGLPNPRSRGLATDPSKAFVSAH